MRHFQVLALTVLTVIAVELGLIVIKLPTPTVQAEVSAPSALPPLTPEHLALKKQLDALAAKLDALSSEMKGYQLSLVEPMAAHVSQAKEMLRKHMGCQYPQCYK